MNKSDEERKMDTVGESDTSGIRSGTDEKGKPEGRVNQWKESEHEYQTDQRKVKESWEDDSIIECENEREDEENEDGDKDSEVKHNQSEASGDILVINDSMETNDREYKPTTSNSEESVISTRNKQLGNKKQTTLMMTSKEANKEKIKNTILQSIKQ